MAELYLPINVYRRNKTNHSAVKIGQIQYYVYAGIPRIGETIWMRVEGSKNLRGKKFRVIDVEWMSGLPHIIVENK